VFTNIKSRKEFRARVEILWHPDYEDMELEEFPCIPSGSFLPDRLEVLLRLARLHPEFHIVSYVGSGIYMNGFVRNARSYCLAQGDADPKLIHDQYDALDAQFLQSLNSGNNKRSP